MNGSNNLWFSLLRFQISRYYYCLVIFSLKMLDFFPLCVCVCVCVWVWVWVWVCVCVCVCVDKHWFVFTWPSHPVFFMVSFCLCIFLPLLLSVCLAVCFSVCLFICMSIICTYLFFFSLSLSFSLLFFSPFYNDKSGTLCYILTHTASHPHHPCHSSRYKLYIFPTLNTIFIPRLSDV